VKAESTSEYLNRHTPRLAAVVRLARGLLNREERILDVGPHYLTTCLQQIGHPVDTLGFWVDGDAGTPELRPGCRHYEADLGQVRTYLEAGLPPRASYGLVVACCIVEHLAVAPWHWMSLFGRLTRPGGKILVSTDNGVSLKRRLRMLAGLQPYPPLHRVPLNGDLGHVREYTNAQLLEAGRVAGLELISHWATQGCVYPGGIGRLYGQVQRLLPPSMRDLMYFVWRRKS